MHLARIGYGERSVIYQIVKLERKGISAQLNNLKIGGKSLLVLLESQDYQASKSVLDQLSYLRNLLAKYPKLVVALNNIMKEIFVIFVSKL
jgi:DNA-binding Lrp family transcriptional regulator